MIVGFSGTLGAGKTLTMVRWALRYSRAAGGAPVWANIRLNPSFWSQHRRLNPRFFLGRIDTAEDIVEATRRGGGILMLDEVHRLLDARLAMATKNIYLSELFMFLRKMGFLTFVSFQTMRLIDVRLRATIDLFVWCQARGAGPARRYEQLIYDYQAEPPRLVGRERQLQEDVEPYFAAYDTYEFVHSFDFPATSRDFDRYMRRIEAASLEARGLAQPAGAGQVDDQAAGDVAEVGA